MNRYTGKATIVSLLAVPLITSCSNTANETPEQTMVVPSLENGSGSVSAAEEERATTNYFGQRVIVPPVDQSGGIARTKELKKLDDICSEAEQKRVPEGLERQQVNSVELIFSSSDGPTTTRAGHIPNGYGQTVSGAILSALNSLSLSYSGGPMQAENLLIFGGLSEVEKQEFENANPNWQEDYPAQKVDLSGAPTLPSAHKVLSCYDDLMVFSFAYKEVGNEEGLYEKPLWIKLDYPVRWTGEQWEADNESSVVVQREVLGEELPLGWEAWEF